MKKIVSLVTLVVMLNVNILLPFSFAHEEEAMFQNDNNILFWTIWVETGLLLEENINGEKNMNWKVTEQLEKDQEWVMLEEVSNLDNDQTNILNNNNLEYDSSAVEISICWENEYYSTWTSKCEQRKIQVQDMVTFETNLEGMNNSENSVTIIYNANGWYFSNNESEKTVTYTKDNEINKYVASENIQFPNKEANWVTWYMFAWWYLESWEPSWQINEWYTQDDELEAIWLWNQKKVYAKWLPFEDLPIVIGWKTVVTIMDRNLWAEEVADWTLCNYGQHEDYSKLGFYYQWWNNYGFKNNWDLLYSDVTNSSNNNRVRIDDYWPNNYYSSSTFKIVQTNPRMWTINNEENLWWWKNAENPDIDKQGPCPAWYHVPDRLEWKAVTDLFKKEKNINGEFCEDFDEDDIWKCFASKLNLPFAGDRSSYDASISSQGNYGTYWSSSPLTEEGLSYYLGFGQYVVDLQYYNGRTMWYSVRCFQNSLPKILTLIIDKNTNESQEIGLRWRESAADKIKALNLNKEWKFIIWWYKDEELTEERDIMNDKIEQDMTLYAKWVEWWIEYLEWQWLIKVYAWDKEYYIKDRNVWVDESENVRWKTKRIVDCMFGGVGDCSEDVLNWFASDLGWNIYYWWNSSGVNVKNIEVDGNNKIISGLPERFNWGNSNNDWWLVWNSDNPCNANKWEYLPTIDDWLNIMEIYWAISGYQLWYEIDDSGLSYMYNDEDNILEIIAGQLLLWIVSPWMILMKESDWSYLYPDPYGYSFTAKDDEWYIWVHLAYWMARIKVEWTWNEAIDDELFSAAVPVRCFVNPVELFNVEFNTNWWSEVNSQTISSWDTVEKPNDPTLEWKVFDGWYTDKSLTHEFDFSAPITSDTILYAKWVEWWIEYLKDKWMIKVYAWDREYYIRDRNVWVDENVDIEELMDSVRNHCMNNDVGCSEDDMRNLLPLIWWNVYFWWNNSGARVNDLIVDEEGNILLESLPEWFDHGKAGEENTWWWEWENDNPCNASKWEYLPTPEDWLNVMKIQWSVRWYDAISHGLDSLDEFYYYFDDDKLEEYGISLLKDLMLHPSLFIEHYNNQLNANIDMYGYTWTSKSVRGLLWYHLFYLIVWANFDGNIDDINELAMWVRCFVHPQNDEGDQWMNGQWEDIKLWYSWWWRRVPIRYSDKNEHKVAEENDVMQGGMKWSEESKSIIDFTEKLDMESYDSSYSLEQNTAYQFAKANGITTKSTIQEAKMNISLTRIQMAKMLSYYAINVLWQSPDISRWIVKFGDVSDSLNKQYGNAVTLAYQLWIMWINIESGKFRPYDEVTRAEFVTALSRMLYWIQDWTWKIKYYEPHMAKLYNEWIITKRDPRMKEKRWYAMLMLMRSTR